MKYWLWLLSFFFISFHGNTQATQTAVLEASNNNCINILQNLAGPYYRVHPFNKDFSAFIAQVVADPDLHSKKVERRTDSTFFFVGGTYQRYNPFIYRPTTVRLVVAESEFTYSDSSDYKDTIIYYQLIVTADTSAQAEHFVKKEYHKLLRKYDKRMKFSTYPLGKENSSRQGEATLCFINPFAVSPLTLAWGRDEQSRAYLFSITLRMKVKENRAFMVTLPHEPIVKGFKTAAEIATESDK